MTDNKRDSWTNINKTDGLLVVAVLGTWTFLMWLASNHLALWA